MAMNKGRNNNFVGIDRKVEALEATFEKIKAKALEQNRQLLATLGKIALDVNNIRPEAVAVRTNGVARGQAVSKFARRRSSYHIHDYDRSEDNCIQIYGERKLSSQRYHHHHSYSSNYQ